jgi:hypothetical protein
MSCSFHSADRGTHHKVIAVALALSVVVGSIGLSSRTNHNLTAATGTGVIKAPKSIVSTNNDTRIIR